VDQFSHTIKENIKKAPLVLLKATEGTENVLSTQAINLLTETLVAYEFTSRYFVWYFDQ